MRPNPPPTERPAPAPDHLPPGSFLRARASAAAALAAAAALCLLPGVSAAQAPADGDTASRGEDAGARWFPDSTAFRPLMAAPREVDLRGSLILASRDAPAGADFQGSNLEAEVALGHRVGVVRLDSGSPGSAELVLGFEVGVFSRFALETPEKALIDADYRVGFPLSVRKGGWSGRITLLHFSAHVGDDFLARFGAEHPRRQMTRDGIELTLARRLMPGLRLYAGGDLNFHANEAVARTAVRGGLEWDPAPERAGSRAGEGSETWPFAAVDLEATSAGSGIAATGTAGLVFRVRGMTLRLEARGHAGPTPMGHLGGRDERFLGIGLRVNPL